MAAETIEIGRQHIGPVNDKFLPVRNAFLHRPTPPAGCLVRPHLITVLDCGIEQPVSLVCAPAGFGKSVLVSQWCEHIERPSAWLSLDPAIDHPRWFLMHLIAAVRQVFPDVLEVTSQMSSADLMPADEAVVAELSNELDELDEPIVIVIDDYHRIDEPRVHNFVADLLRHPPLAVHLVIVSREEPPLPIGTLRAQGRLNELRIADLAFSIDEVRLFMDQELGRSLTPQQIDQLHTETEGWPAGARLVAHALRNGDGDGAIVGAGFLDQAAQEYLITDLVDHVPPEVQRHLYVASHFDRFSDAICDAAASNRPTIRSEPTMTGAEFIDWLRQHNLFVIQLDPTGDWYRFHHLFARLLANWRASNPDGELSEETIRRAGATIFRDQGMVDEAIEQLHLANAHHDLATIAATHGNQLIEQERWVELDRLLSGIPTDLLDTDPELLILSAWLLGMVHFRHWEMREVLDRVEFLLDQTNDAETPTVSRLRGHVAMLRGAYVKLVQSDFEGAITDSEEARRRLHDHPGRSLSFAYTLGVISLASSGRSEDAHRLADSLVGDPRFADIPLDPTTWARLVLAWMEGDLHALERHAAIARSIGARLGLPGITAVGHYFSGACAYEQNRLIDAVGHLSIVFDQRFTAEALLVVEAGAALACTELALGRPDDADATAHSLMQFALDTRSEFLQPVADAFVAELELPRGRTGSGLRWARSNQVPSDQHHFMWFDPVPARIEVLLASEPDAARGRELLDRALESAQRRHHCPFTIRLLGIHALDLAARGDEPAALAALETAVSLAYHGGIIRRLADLGPRLAPLLHRLDVTGDILAHVGAILTALEPPEHERSDIDLRVPTLVAGQPALTARETEVLRLLAARYSNKEIALELIIAPATVKKHTVTLYDKLNVHGRREAVAKAHTLGYINP